MTHVDYGPLRKTARYFDVGFQIAIVVTCALALGVLIATVMQTQATGALLSDLTGYAIQPRAWQTVALAGIVCFGLGLYAATFFAAKKVSGGLLRGEVAVAGGAARQLARWLWAVLIWSTVAHTLAVLISTAHAGPGQRALSIAIGSPQLSIAITALVAAFLAQVLTLVAALWEDHKGIV